MDTHDTRNLLSHLSRIAIANERIADALEKANELNPLAMINEAMAAEAGNVSPTEPVSNVPPDIDPSDEWRFR